MQKRLFLISGMYSMFQAIAGLLLHPYQTMQHLVAEKVFLFLVLAPSVLGAVSAFLWWVGLKYLFLHLPYIGLWAFSAIWIAFFFIFWQILLLYLLFRFLISFRKK